MKIDWSKVKDYFSLRGRVVRLKLVDSQFNNPIIQLKVHGNIHNFLIDTGAEGSMLSKEIIGNREIAGYLTASGYGGTCKEPVYHARFNLLGVSIDLLPEMNINVLATASQRGFKLSGLIGQDVLSQLRWYTFDNIQQLFIFEPR